ncbi:MAG: 50S ribosomal protein L21e [Candidatus Aenigmatarchaeota archaeon]|nr:MAG: 50S ribosomal protein L21e [Candidatus Aenigmarchaeota archaeon]
MVRASKGLRTGTRRKLSKGARDKFTVTPYLREFKPKDRVTVIPDPSSHKGMPHIRFKGVAGVVKGRRGDSYMVEVSIGNKKKTITARPEHLNPA